jgi:hypothetical protein
MYAIIEGEVHSSLEAMIASKSKGSSYSNVDRQAVLDAILYGGDKSTLDSVQKKVYDNVVKEYKTTFNTLPNMTAEDYGEYNAITDMFSAFTTHPVTDPVNDPDSRWALFGGYAHGEKYWHGFLQNSGKNVSTEFFAEYFAAYVTGNTAQCANFQRYFPLASEAMERMIIEIMK